MTFKIITLNIWRVCFITTACLLFQLTCLLAEMTVDNFKNKEVIRYSVPLIKGKCGDKKADHVIVLNTSNPRAKITQGLAHEGQYKALTELVPGRNKLTITQGEEEKELTLIYKPQTNPYKVRAVYFIDKTKSTKYQTCFKDDKFDYAGKFDTALKLMQSFSADWLHEHGYGRKTFNLETDKKGRVVVHLVNVGDKKKLMGGGRGHLFGKLASAAGKQLPKGKFTNIGTVAFSEHQPDGGATFYTALGGGNFALLGGACFYTWPSSISEVHKRFMLDMPVDTNKYHTDDNGKNAVWATASTTIGNALHELGHAFGLPHCVNGHGIMRTAGGRFNRHFTFMDPPSRWSKKYKPFEDAKCKWVDVSAASLAATREFALDAKDWKSKNEIDFSLDLDKCEVMVSSPDGIQFCAVEKPGKTDYFVDAKTEKKAPKYYKFKAEDLRDRFQTDHIQFRAYDSEGHNKTKSLQNLFSFPCIREWRVPVGKSMHWADKNKFNKLSDKQLKDIIGSAKTAPMHKSEGDRVEMSKVRKIGKKSKVSAFAYRQIVCPEDENATFYYDFDDAGRFWLNGKLIAEKIKGGKASRDHFNVSAQLKKGRNDLLIESSNNSRSWGFYFRMTSGGLPVELTKNGKLEPLSKWNKLILLFRGPYVKEWFVSETTASWNPKSKELPEINSKSKVNEIYLKTLSGKEAKISTDTLDLGRYHHVGHSSKPSISYLATSILSKSKTNIKLVYQTTVPIRIWMNGKHITSLKNDQQPQKEDHKIQAQLQKGKNEILIETAHTGKKKKWLVSLRAETTSGKALAVLPGGSLVPYPEKKSNTVGKY